MYLTPFSIDTFEPSTEISRNPFFYLFIVVGFSISTLAQIITTYVGRQLPEFHIPWGISQETGAVSTDTTAPLIFDAGLYLLPHLDTPWLPDLIMGICFFVFLGVGGNRLHRLLLFLHCQAWVLLLRSATILATIDRSSARCQTNQLHFSENPGCVFNSHCFDLMFSGHTATGTILCYLVMQNPSLRHPQKLAVIMLAIANACTNIAVGDHFSRDILVAVFISLLVSSKYATAMSASYSHLRDRLSKKSA